MTLKNIIKNHRSDITTGLLWIVIYKVNTSWNYAAFCQTSGSYEDGLIFDDNDMKELRKIAKTDPKAICINGVINNIDSKISLGELENKIRTLYVLRHSQLNGDFLGSIVPLF